MIGFIGGGNMAEALIKGIMSGGKKDVIVSEPRVDRREFLIRTYGVTATASNTEAAGHSEIIILAVKPQNMAAVLDEISPAVTSEKTVVSIAAGITLSFLQSRLKTDRLIRVMPNTPALVQEGMSVISLCSCLPVKIVEPVRDIFSSIGKVLTLPEKQMNAVTALSGSGPGFVALFTEALIASGEKMGLSPDNALELAVQTVIGTAKLLETGMPPVELRKMVTSPGGTTAAGIRTFEEKGLAALVAEALEAARKRAEDLASA
ncbi:MAG TPA: pyrroline-5-carboxylate reductase [Dissulfurispiraceae bacterium]|nr:pyrroline-5-carboxylate reductase [Dissulfurispiraceae bacterium]